MSKHQQTNNIEKTWLAAMYGYAWQYLPIRTEEYNFKQYEEWDLAAHVL